MPKKVTIFTILFVLTLTILGCSKGEERKQEAFSRGQDVEAIARTVCEGVGAARKVLKGTKGPPIMILEERHDSRAGQIQHAITLVRLHDRHGLKHIALEGYLKERPEIKTDWFTRAARELGEEDRDRVAVRLLQEGEISSAEFMILVYGDVSLHPIETIGEYSVELGEDATRAPLLYLLKIAQQSLRQEHIPKLQEFQADIGKIEGKEKHKKTTEMFDYILSADPWAQAKAKLLQDTDSIRVMSAEKQLATMEEIDNRAKELSIEFEPDEKKAMEHNLRFLRERIAASKTMVLSVGEIADRQDASVVAMIIGAAHTEKICEMLSTSDRPFAVVTPLSLKEYEEKGDITWDMLERKYKRLPIYSEGFTEMLLKAFPPSQQKKPEPVLSDSWLQAKAELYLFTERIAGGVLGPPNPPGGGRPPYGFGDDDFKGRWVRIDPKLIHIVPDDEDRKKGRAVLFPAILNPDDPEGRTPVWVKAGLGVAEVAKRERESVESMLMKALRAVQSEQEPRKKAEDAAGRVQITLNTMAAYASTQQAARRVVLGAI